MGKSILIIVAAWFLALTAGVVHAAPYQSSAHGYSVNLPTDWTRIPPEVLNEFSQAVRAPGAKASFSYDAGFQPSGTEWFTYPYVIVQITPYPNGRQIREKEFDDVMKMLASVNPQKEIEKQLSKEAQALIGETKIQPPTLDKANRKFTWETTMQVTGIGSVRGRTTGFFGRDALVQVNFYSKAENYQKHLPRGQAIMDSFQFDDNKKYDESKAGSGFDFSRIGSKILIFVVIGAVIAFFKRRASA